MNHYTALTQRLYVPSLRSGFSWVLFFSLISSNLSAQDADDCIRLLKVDLVADEAYAIETHDTLAAFTGRCIDPVLIHSLISELSNLYIDAGYITTRPYIQEQDISDGQIEVQLLPGLIETIVTADEETPARRLFTALPFYQHWLNLRDLESALETFERVPSAEADFKIKPGATQGTSVVEIEIVDTKPWRFEIGVNGKTGLDPGYSARLSIDNPLQINDIIEIQASNGSVREAYQTNQGDQIAYSFPLGSYLFELSRGSVSYRQRVQGLNDSYLSSGDTEASSVKINKLLARSKTSKLSSAVALHRKDTEAFFEDVLVEVSSYKTAQLQFELSHEWYHSRGQFSNRLIYDKGLDSYGARDDGYFTVENGFDNEARLQFSKYTIDSRSLFVLSNPAYRLSQNLHLQYSDDILFDNDKLNLGSIYSVRGYSSALSGSKGWYLRNDFSKNLKSQWRPYESVDRDKYISLSLGLDYGEIKCDRDSRDACGDIYGLSVSTSITDTVFSLSFIWGHPLKQINDEVGKQDQYSLDLRWSF